MLLRAAPLLALAFGFAVARGSAADNPFLPKNAPGPATASAHESIEFAGVSQMGKTTHLIFQDKAAKKNRWIMEGETVEGISVLKYDPRLEQVVVKINGTEKTLALRKAAGPINTPAPVVPPPPAAGFNVPAPAVAVADAQPAILAPSAPAPAASPAPAVPQPKPPAPGTPEATTAKAETEARMLVSDLLEIGMAQRKAYEEAQRRAAEGKAGQPPAQAQPKQ